MGATHRYLTHQTKVFFFYYYRRFFLHFLHFFSRRMFNFGASNELVQLAIISLNQSLCVIIYALFVYSAFETKDGHYTRNGSGPNNLFTTQIQYILIINAEFNIYSIYFINSSVQ